MKEKKPRKWVACDLEAEYFGDERKISRAERKIAKAKDRSQYKKTDQDKIKKKTAPTDSNKLMRGRVLSIISQGINVESNGKIILCTLRGSLKKNKSQLKNLITVGDYVLFDLSSENEGVIEYVEERFSILSRADHLHQRKEQLIAANIDQVLITTSVVTPSLKPFLIDRYIIAARKGNMQPIIVVNKIELLKDNPDEEILYKEFVKVWKDSHIPIVSVSTKTKEGLSELEAIMKDKASVFSGQSGVGKSSLINAITKHDLLIGDVVSKTKKGAHTTTQARLLPLECGGFVIDTPGIKSFGVWNLEPDEIEEYFSEFIPYKQECKFPNCSHTHEAPCGVIDAAKNDNISWLRYESYLYLLESVKKDHKPR